MPRLEHAPLDSMMGKNVLLFEYARISTHQRREQDKGLKLPLNVPLREIYKIESASPYAFEFSVKREGKFGTEDD